MPSGYNLALFASEKGPGDAERASIMSHTGTYLAKKGARLICPVLGGALGVPLVKSAIAAGGNVCVYATHAFNAPEALKNVEIERFATEAEMRQRLGTQVDAYIGLPGSLASATQLFQTWVDTGSEKPMALLNRNKAFEVIRGFGADVLSHSVRNWEKKLLIAESVEDLWAKLPRIIPRS